MDRKIKPHKSGDRIAKAIARAGLASRREAEAWIAAGRVAVNGSVIQSAALNVSDGDRITVDGEPLPVRERTRLFLYHKPRGLITTHADPQGRPTIFARLPRHLPRLVSVGRLDFNTEGLLLLTNDGALARVLELPATGWLRRYRVRAHGSLTQDRLDGLRDGITIAGIRYGPVEAQIDRVQGSKSLAHFRNPRRQEPRSAPRARASRPYRHAAHSRVVRAVSARRGAGGRGGRGAHARAARTAWRAHHRARRRGLLRAIGISACQAKAGNARAQKPESGKPHLARSSRGGNPKTAAADIPWLAARRRHAASACRRDPRECRCRQKRPSRPGRTPWAAEASGTGPSETNRETTTPHPRLVGSRLRSASLPSAAAVDNAGRRRTLAWTHAGCADLAVDPPDCGSAAQILVQHSGSRLRRSGQRRARARPVRRHWRARHRGAVTRRGVCAVRRPGGRGAGAAARQRHDARPRRRQPDFRRDATRLGPAHPVEPFSLVFLDPPYGRGLAAAALVSAREGGWLAPGALSIVEESGNANFAPPDGFSELERRRYDDSEFIILRSP